MVTAGKSGQDPREKLFEQLASRRLLVVSGKGGVGRSTVALMVAKELASRGRRVLLATTGTDDRLASLCGLQTLTETPQSPSGGLSLMRLEPAQCVREYAEMVLWSRRIARAIFENKVVRRLLSAVPGMEDFAVLGKVWHEATRAHNYDHVVFDGPASGHLKTTLRAPASIAETLKQGPLAKEAQSMLASLRDPTKVGLVLVALPQAWPLTELSELVSSLQNAPGIPSAALVVNQRWDMPIKDVPEVDIDAQLDPKLAACLELVVKARQRALADAQAIEAWRASLQGELARLPLVELPYLARGLDGPAAFSSLQGGIAVHAHAGLSGVPPQPKGESPS